VCANGVPTGAETFDAADIQSLSRSYYNPGGQVIYSDSYSSMPGGTYYLTDAYIGEAGTNYLRTTYSYNRRGWLKRTLEPTGTIRRTIYDNLGRPTSTWVGTSDTVTGTWGPDNAGGMVKIGQSEYDADGNLTSSTAWADGSTSYQTKYYYDFRGRQIAAIGPDNVITATEYDNLARPTFTRTYADVDSDYATAGLEAGELRGQSQNLYDERGQVYQSKIWAVDSSGNIGHSLTSKYWYNARGMLIKSEDANGLFNKSEYDGAGRLICSYTSFDSNESLYGGYSDADDVTNDTVIEQSRSCYDNGGRLVASVLYQRLESDNSSTGALNAGNSYATDSVFWYDKADRQIASAFYGRETAAERTAGTYLFSGTAIRDTNANGIPDIAEGSAPSPNTSDDYIVTKTEYNPAGLAYRTTDNKGHVAETQFDLLGRTTKTIGNYGDGAASETETDTNQIVELEYDSKGRLATQIALNPKGSGNGVEQQKTRYVYGSTIDAAWPTAVVYPDSTDTVSWTNGAWVISSGSDHVATTYDQLGRKLTTTDQRGVIHAFAYDSAGRLSSDAITTCPAGVNDDVLRIHFGYDDVGRVQTLTSYDDDSGGNIVNQIKYTFDGWGNVVKSEQAHDGAVTTGTPAVQYAYEDGADGSVAKYVRLDYVTYPDGRVVYYNYPTSGVGSVLSRLDNIADNSSGTDPYVKYTYLGAGTVVKVEHPAVSGGLTLSYGSAGTYGGWDRFGRIVQQHWTNGDDEDPVDKDFFSYAYDRNSNRLYRKNQVNADFSELYHANSIASGDDATGYDGLDRLTSFARAVLSASGNNGFDGE
jgi:YD repeat-containing protein